MEVRSGHSVHSGSLAVKRKIDKDGVVLIAGFSEHVWK